LQDCDAKGNWKFPQKLCQHQLL